MLKWMQTTGKGSTGTTGAAGFEKMSLQSDDTIAVK